MKLIAVSAVIFGLLGCGAEQEAKKLGFSTVEEMNAIQAKGWHTKSQYDTDTALLNKIALEKKQREEAIARRDAAVAKELERLTVSDGYPIRAQKPIRPLDYKFENKNVVWLNNLPFGASKEAIENAIPSLVCTADRKGCTSGIDKNLNQQCLLGIDRACEAIVLFFSDDNKLESIFVTYKIVEIRSDPVVFFVAYLTQELGPASSIYYTSIAGIKTLHNRWKVGRHEISVNSYTREQDNTSMFLSLKIDQNPNF